MCNAGGPELGTDCRAEPRYVSALNKGKVLPPFQGHYIVPLNNHFLALLHHSGFYPFIA